MERQNGTKGTVPHVSLSDTGKQNGTKGTVPHVPLLWKAEA